MIGVLAFLRGLSAALRRPRIRETERPALIALRAREERRASAAASVPFMITRQTRLLLLGRGYTDHDIDQMSPQRAHDILAGRAPRER